LISVILTVYARPQNLDLQIEAIQNQTIPPDEIIIVVDKNQKIDFDIKKYQQFQVIQFHKNVGVWGRFSIALLTRNPYICVFDDDTIPGAKWFENCINTYKKVDGLLGTVGVLFNEGSIDYDYSKRVGWPSANSEIELADIVGHSWFFKREHIEAFWQNTENHSKFKKSGEDIHFSYILKNKLGLNTYVPPHPKNDTSLWGSLPEYSNSLGSDENALSLETISTLRMSYYMKKVRKDGFVFLSEINSEKIKIMPSLKREVNFYRKNIWSTLKLFIKNLIRKN
tara:strand:+ start:3915 stop:4760 length:846 start_codon:yes stop_codon:yes gene_type:complete